MPPSTIEYPPVYELMSPEVQYTIPWNKSQLNNYELKDIEHGNPETADFIDSLPPESVSDDMWAMSRCYHQSRQGNVFDVGESGSLYRRLKFYCWKNNLDFKFVLQGSLIGREITDDPAIIDLPLIDLLELDGGTSQWASAAVLLGNKETPPANMPFKLVHTYRDLHEWEQAKIEGRPTKKNKDDVSAYQAYSYLEYKRTGDLLFTPLQAEDYCMARAYGLITPVEGLRRWPQLVNHESNRIKEMEKAIQTMRVDKPDHRLAIAMLMAFGDAVEIVFPGCVNKSWPLIYKFLQLADN